jgi:hypothetical protein
MKQISLQEEFEKGRIAFLDTQCNRKKVKNLTHRAKIL